MKDHFNFLRFGRLFKKHTTEQYKSYLMAWVVLISALGLVTGFVAYMTKRPLSLDEQSVCFLFFLVAAGTIFTSTVFASLGDKRKAVATLTLPASHLEKYLVGWLYSYLIFQALFILSFYLVMPVILSLYAPAGPAPKLLNIFSLESMAYLAFIFYTFLHAFALVGSIYFEKLHFIKTGFVFFLLYLGLLLLNKSVLKALFPPKLDFMIPFGRITFQENNDYFWLTLPPEQQNLLILVPLTLAVLCWLTAYVRFKEKQI